MTDKSTRSLVVLPSCIEAKMVTPWLHEIRSQNPALDGLVIGSTAVAGLPAARRRRS